MNESLGVTVVGGLLVLAISSGVVWAWRHLAAFPGLLRRVTSIAATAKQLRLQPPVYLAPTALPAAQPPPTGRRLSIAEAPATAPAGGVFAVVVEAWNDWSQPAIEVQVAGTVAGATFANFDVWDSRWASLGASAAIRTNVDGQARFEVLVPKQSGMRVDLTFEWDELRVSRTWYSVQPSPR